MSSSLRIIVTGLIGQHPWLGGVAWDYVQYLVGLAQLGHDVYYLEDTGEWPYNLDGSASGDNWVAEDCSHNVRHIHEVLSRFGLGERWAYRNAVDSQWYGMNDSKREQIIRSADLLINVSGTLERPELYRNVKRLLYIDSDPVFTQIKLASNQTDFCQRVETHDVHFSFGESLSGAVPETAYKWKPTRQPILLSQWRPSAPRGEKYTTVMSWTSYPPLLFNGRTYGQKDLEFLHILDLPRHFMNGKLEVALSRTQHTSWRSEGSSLSADVEQWIREHPEYSPVELLQYTGWHVTDPYQHCADLDSYRQYIESSRAELSVAKHGYVVGQAGWFSCRSACYLAAGRPVIVQDTGFSQVLPVGSGLLTYRNRNEAVEALNEVEDNYTKHAEAARALAEDYFDSDRVLTRLLEDAMAENNSLRSQGVGV